MDIIKRHPNEPARDYAYREIYRNIVTFELPPGAEISVQKISEELAVSRTPVREAFLQLQFDRIIEVIPQSGSHVAYVDFENVNDSRFVRLAMERAVLDEVCVKATPEDIAKLETNLELQQLYLSKNLRDDFLKEDDNFHDLLFQIAGKERIQAARNFMAIHFNRVRVLWMNMYGVDAPHLIREHMEIVDAVRARDLQWARRAIDKHLSGYSLQEQEEIRNRYPQYFAK